MSAANWQSKLVPFIVILIVMLFVVYMWFYFKETSDIQVALANPPQFSNTDISKMSFAEKKWNNLYELERYNLNNRYYHARLIIRSRILIISLSFLTGITLSFIGSIFIMGKYSESSTQIGAGGDKLNLKLISSSPGIILSFLGVVLIAISIYTKIDLNIVDASIYMPYSTLDTNQIKNNPIVGPKTLQSYPTKTKSKDVIDSIIKAQKKSKK
ncbi:MAG TPA: hypothetical protein VG367_10395 [Mucilaginibacter sp.]|jgi:hypothetical protein|nr:hypothetical protein [Mucilaginibacter sp.]